MATFRELLAEARTHIDEVDPAGAQALLADGWLLLAGRREPRTGGILLARGERDEIAAKAATDPFVVNGAASFDLIEFLPARAASVNLDTLLP